jgi:hypothetical protein
MPAEVKLYDIDGDGRLEVLGTAYDTSQSKVSPPTSSSVFIWKFIPEAECTEDSDCSEGYACVGGVCTETICGLRIRPEKRNAHKFRDSAQRTYRIRGNKSEQGFDPYAEIDFGPFRVVSTHVTKKGVLKVDVELPAGETIEEGFVDVRVGNCIGEIEIR